MGKNKNTAIKQNYQILGTNALAEKKIDEIQQQSQYDEPYTIRVKVIFWTVSGTVTCLQSVYIRDS